MNELQHRHDMLLEDVEAFEDESRILNNIILEQERTIELLLDEKLTRIIGDAEMLGDVTAGEMRDFIREELHELVQAHFS